MSQSSKSKVRATGRIEVKNYEDKPYDQPPEGPALHILKVTEDFHGDIEGAGQVQFLQAMRAEGSASYVGIERVVGKLAGRSGSFLLQDQGTLVNKQVKGEWFVVPDSGTGELKGLRGEGGFAAELGQHAQIWLDYWFE